MELQVRLLWKSKVVPPIIPSVVSRYRRERVSDHPCAARWDQSSGGPSARFPPSMPRVCFAADLHLFARRSSANLHLSELIDVANESEICVLGGDIFDFRWSRYANDEATAQAATEWLTAFDEQTNHCTVHFLLGNHDDHPALLERLPALEQLIPTFEWSRYYFRLGNTLFLHGDVADRTMTEACLHAQRDKIEHHNRSEMHHRLYDMVIKAQLHRLAPPAVYPRRRVAKRILNYINDIGHGPETGVEHVCFGHTHRPMDHFHYKGIHFHNCGAPIGGAPFRILTRNVVLPSASS